MANSPSPHFPTHELSPTTLGHIMDNACLDHLWGFYEDKNEENMKIKSTHDAIRHVAFWQINWL